MAINERKCRNNMIGRNVLRRPFFYDCAVEYDTIYFSMCYYNALCRADLSTNQVEIIATFPDIPCEKGNEYFGMYKYENYLLLGPAKSKDDFLIYDITHSQFFKISNEGENNFYSTRAFGKGSYIYIVTANNAEVNRIDLKDFSVRKIICKELSINNGQVTNVARIKDLLYIPLNQKKKMLLFNMQDESFRYFEFPSNISFIATIDYYNGRFWITGEGSQIYVWDINESEAKKIADFSGDVKLFYDGNIWFGNSFIFNNSLWLFPTFADSIVRYNILLGKIEKFELEGEEESVEQIEEELKSGRRFASKYGVVKRDGNKAFFLSSKTRVFYELDLSTNGVYKHDFQMINVYSNQIYPPIIGNQISEWQYGLEWLIRAITKNIVNGKAEKEKRIGENVYRNIILEGKME